jgi:Fur family ferric uptake transcriptional regulator
MGRIRIGTGAAIVMPDGIGSSIAMPQRIEQLCIEKGLKMTGQRRVIARVLAEASDHPDVEQVHRRAAAIDPRISIATVYRTVKLFEEASILARLDFGDGRSRYEETPEEHHDHLIDMKSGRVIEFHNEEIERLQREVARQHGFELVGHRMELYGVPLANRESDPPEKKERPQ